jgi:hypothetical protein
MSPVKTGVETAASDERARRFLASAVDVHSIYGVHNVDD